MLCALFSLLAAGLPPSLGEVCGSYLYQPAFCLDDVRRGPAESYLPQPGDIMLRLDHSIFWRVTHYMALAFDPNGSGIVFARPDGSLAVLEAGPNDTLWVGISDMLPHLQHRSARRSDDWAVRRIGSRSHIEPEATRRSEHIPPRRHDVRIAPRQPALSRPASLREQRPSRSERRPQTAPDAP